MSTQYYLSSDLNKVKEFLQNGYTTIEVNSENFQNYAADALQDFVELTREPDEFKNKWTFDLGLIGKPDTGYLRRIDEESKHFLHAHRFLRNLLIFRKVFPKKYQRLINYCNQISSQTHERLIQFAHALDQVMPGVNIAERISSPESVMQSVLRLLQYDHVIEHKEIAEAHEDQSVLTAAVYESHQGLFLGVDRANLYKQSTGSMLVFAGKKLEILTGGEQYYEETSTARIPKVKGGEVKACTHGVVSLPDLYGADYERCSAVYFAHDADTELLPKVKKEVTTSFERQKRSSDLCGND
jgi:isopenicillin N synthase-like dioxygenase